MWFTVIFFAIVAVVAIGSIWESRRKRALFRGGSRAGASGDAGSLGHNSGSAYGHGSWHDGYGDAGSTSSGDCGGSGGGGGGGDGGGGGGC